MFVYSSFFKAHISFSPLIFRILQSIILNFSSVLMQLRTRRTILYWIGIIGRQGVLYAKAERVSSNMHRPDMFSALYGYEEPAADLLLLSRLGQTAGTE